MRRKHGNTGWSRGKAVPMSSGPSEFELYVRKLGLAEQNYATSVQLRRWCEQNRNRCYIPESLLKEWGIYVDPNMSDG